MRVGGAKVHPKAQADSNEPNVLMKGHEGHVRLSSSGSTPAAFALENQI